MKAYTWDDFYARLQGRGIGWERKYRRHLVFHPEDQPSLFRFWEYPEDAAQYLGFLELILDTCDAWLGCFVFFDELSLYDPERKEFAHPTDRKELAALGVPVEREEIIVWFDCADRQLLLAALTQQMCDCRDCTVVLDPAEQLVTLDHHEVVTIWFSDTKRLDSYVESLAKSDVYLPDGPPDPTFKPQSWFGFLRSFRSPASK